MFVFVVVVLASVLWVGSRAARREGCGVGGWCKDAGLQGLVCARLGHLEPVEPLTIISGLCPRPV